jgi:hypothetical protein
MPALRDLSAHAEGRRPKVSKGKTDLRVAFGSTPHQTRAAGPPLVLVPVPRTRELPVAESFFLLPTLNHEMVALGVFSSLDEVNASEPSARTYAWPAR